MRLHKILPLAVICVSFALPSAALTGVDPIFRMSGLASEESSLDMKKGLDEVKTLIKFSCEQVYPKPTVVECIDRVKHGIGASFDPHSGYMSENEYKSFTEGTQGAFGGVGIEISKISPASPLVVMNVMDDTPSHRAGLLAGDVVLSITEPGKESIPTVSLKNVGEAVKLLRGTPDTTVILRVVRKGVDTPMNITIKREIINVLQVKGELIQSGDKTYALLWNKQFSNGNQSAMRTTYFNLLKRAHGKLSGLIIRLENNPGGLLDEAYNDVDLFLDAPSTVLIRSNDGVEVYEPPRSVLARTHGDITKGLPILVVVNGGSASAAEIFAAAMKHFGRAVIAGTSRTFGKGIVQAIYPAPGSGTGTAIKLTSSEYLIGSLSDWIPVQCVGIEPDILFEYSGIKKQERPTECEMSEHVNSGGPMINPPLHRPIKEANVQLYKAGEAMLEAYKSYVTPQLLQEEEKRKQYEVK